MTLKKKPPTGARLYREVRPGQPGSLTYQKLKARAYRVVAAAGQTVEQSKIVSATVSSSNASRPRWQQR